MIQRSSLFLSALLFTVFLVSCDRTLPPGVSKEDVAEVSAKPDFNAEIRPLLWELKNSSAEADRTFWENVSEHGLSHEALARDLKAGITHGLDDSKDQTLMWRWTQDGGGVDFPSWLYAPLPRGERLLKEPLDEESQEKLVSYWVKRMGEENEAFSQWFSSQIKNNEPYHSVIQKLFTDDKMTHSSTLFPLSHSSSAFLTPGNRPDKFSLLLGELSASQTQEIEGLFNDFKYAEHYRFYTEEALTEISQLEGELTEWKSEMASLIESPESYEEWKKGSPAYVPLTPATHHLSFQEESGAGYFTGGREIKNEPSLIIDGLESLTAFSFWMRGAVRIELKSELGSTEMVITQGKCVMSNKTKGGIRTDTHSFPLSSTNGWYHILYARDPFSEGGDTFKINGQPFTSSALSSFSDTDSIWATAASEGRDGVIDEVKVYEAVILSALEQENLYDQAAAQTAFREGKGDLLIPHFNFQDAETQARLKEGYLKRMREIEKIKQQGALSKVLPPLTRYNLVNGTYFSNALPLQVGRRDLSELSTWLTGEGAPWVARATVAWVYEAVHGAPLIDFSFPQDQIPEAWAEIDELAASFLKSNWDLSALTSEIKRRGAF